MDKIKIIILKNNHLKHQIALTLLESVGTKTAKKILAYTGQLESVFDTSVNLKTAIPGMAKERFRKLNRKEALENAEKILQYVNDQNIETAFFTEKEYPYRLKEYDDSPLLLYKKGNFEMNHKRTIAIVGTRNMTSYGKQIINELIQTIAPYDVQIISGLALGVDGYVHEKCLELNIPTIGILGHGLDRIYPSAHHKLAQKMLITKGCGLLTEFPHQTIPDRENFPKRNRIVAGMADAIIVIESGKKGGSLITASLGNDYNKDVFAYPGNVNQEFSKGCNFIIAKNKAHLITRGKDFINLMGWEIKEKNIQFDLFKGLNGEEKNIVETILKFNKISLDVLSLHLKKPVHTLSSLLLGLELKGLIMTLPGKNYTLSSL